MDAQGPPRPALSPRAQQLKEELLGEFSLTVDDVAGILEVDRSTVYRYIQDGALAALKIGREYRLSEVDVKGFLQALIERERQRVGELRVGALVAPPAPEAGAPAAAPGPQEPAPIDEPGPFGDGTWGEMVSAVWSQAAREARARGHAETHPGHMLLALLSDEPYRRWGSPFRGQASLADSLARRALDHLGADLAAIREAAEATLPAPTLPPGEGKDEREHSPELRKWNGTFSAAAEALHRPWVGTDAVLLAAYDLAPLAAALAGGGAAREAVEGQLLRLAPRLAPGPRPPLAERARLVVHMALDRALAARRAVATPEDLLLSLLADAPTAREGIARQILDEVGADLAAVRQAAELALPAPQPGPGEAGEEDPEPSPALRTVVAERAAAAARGLGHDEVGTEHLLLGLYSVTELADALERAGAPHARVRAAIRRRLPPNAPQPEERRPLFGRYSERSQRVMVHAQELARAAHIDYVAPAHLLVALLDGEVGGLAQKVLQTLGADPAALRAAAAALLPARAAAGDGAGQQIQFTPSAKAAVMDHAPAAAANLGHAYVGTEHLLLGLYGVEQTAGLLQSAGVPQEGVEAEILRALSGPPAPPEAGMPLDPVAQAAVRAATEEVRRLGTTVLHPGHLLLGLLADDPAVRGGSARAVFDRLGVDAAALRAAVESALPRLPRAVTTRDPVVMRLDAGGAAQAPPAQPHGPAGGIPVAPEAARILHERAPAAARAHGAAAVRTEHLLLALYPVADLAELLAAHGAPADAVEVEVGKG